MEVARSAGAAATTVSGNRQETTAFQFLVDRYAGSIVLQTQNRGARFLGRRWFLLAQTEKAPDEVEHGLDASNPLLR